MRTIFIICLMFMKISCSLRIEKDITTYDHTEAVYAVLHYLDTLHQKIHYNYGPPFKVRQTLFIDTTLCMYYKCNAYYYYLYIKPDAMTVFKSVDKNKTYDFEAIQKLVDKEWKLSLNTSEYSLPVNILTTKDKIFYGKENQYSKWPEGTFLFSPLIPMREKDHFKIWMKITHHGDPLFYEFNVKKKGKLYEVYGHEEDNWCIWGYDKDYIKELNKK